MNVKLFFTALALLVSLCAVSQAKPYTDSLERVQRDYVASHEVVKGDDKRFFRFYPVDAEFRITAGFQKINDPVGFIMKTSGTKTPKYFRYGVLHFKLKKKDVKLTIYQSEKLMADTAYQNYLFVPFTDLSSGEKSYGGGRYLDFKMDDIKDGILIIDFNKAYNPYCAFATGFNCPIPPAENDLPVSIDAGEMAFAKEH